MESKGESPVDAFKSLYFERILVRALASIHDLRPNSFSESYCMFLNRMAF